MENCQIALYCKTEPIVETSHNVEFRPFNGSYDGFDEHMKAANLDMNTNKWKKVFDFSKNDEEVPQPHFKRC